MEPDKTELNFFQKPGVAHPMPAPVHILLLDPLRCTYYMVLPSDDICYLGFFIQRGLKWDRHITIMCNRARASVKMMKLLGNTIRGLSMANWG